MKVPLEIVFRGVEKTDSIVDLINKKVEKLQKICDYISSCRVAIERDQMHQSRGSPYRVRVNLTVPPSHELVVRRESIHGSLHDTLPMIIRLVFRSATRQLRKLTQKQRYMVKSHVDVGSIGTVYRLFADQGYGFIYTPDGRDIYFHRDSVLHNEFEDLVIGSTVRFAEELGDAGPQASSVEIVAKPRLDEEEVSTRTKIPQEVA